MKTLSYYLLESKELNTRQQEVLTCILFDMYFNQNIDKENIFETFVEELEKNPKNNILTQVNNLSKTNLSIDEINKLSKDWKDSFIYQIESMENFLNSNPINKNNKNLLFIHHDEEIGICNGKIETNCAICKRVETAVNEYGITSNKDDYQKADIYVQSNSSSFKVDPNPEPTIEEELAWWIDNRYNLIGVSLKKLVRQIKHPHFYNIDNTSLGEGKISEIVINFDPFTTKKNEKSGKVSTDIFFFLGWGGSTIGKIITLRSNKGIHLDVPATYRSPTLAIELLSKEFSAKKLLDHKSVYQDIENPANDANEGKLKAQFDKIIKSTFKNSQRNEIYTAEELYNEALKMKSLVDGFSNKISITEFSKPSDDLELNTIRLKNVNDDKITEMSDAKIIKWSKIVEKQIQYLTSILEYAGGDENKLKKILFNMVQMAKGVNTDKNISDEADYTHLPYVMLG